MTQSSTSPEAITRLKQLLFDQEVREIDTLAARFAALHEAVGDDERLRHSVAQILDGAIAEAERTKHRELAGAMAPMVLRTLRTEMRSPDMQDHIAGVMYPRMGEMVKRYVASAVRDMMMQINRRLESGLTHNRVALWFRSLTTGRSMAELAIAETQTLEVDEIYLIRRGSGVLVHHWERAGNSAEGAGDGQEGQAGNRDALVSGFLTAITSFAEDAFESQREALRTLDLDDFRIYIRGSPAYLLAVKCKGATGRPLEQLFEDELIRVLGAHQKIEQDTRLLESDKATEVQGREFGKLLEELAGHLETESAEQARAETKRSDFRTVKTFAWFIGLPLAAVFAWQIYLTAVTARLQYKADQVVAHMPELAGYPVRISVERGARRMSATGLLPTERSRQEIMAKLEALAPKAVITPEFSVLLKDVASEDSGKAARKRALERARLKLTYLASNLTALHGRMREGSDRQVLDDVLGSVEKTKSQIDKIWLEPDEPKALTLRELNASISAFEVEIDKLAAAAGVHDRIGSKPPKDVVEATDVLAQLSDRVTVLAAMLEQLRQVRPLAVSLSDVRRQTAKVGERAAQVEQLTNKVQRQTDEVAQKTSAQIAALNVRLERRVEELEAKLKAVGSKAPSVLDELRSFVAANAIFFQDQRDYRDPQAADQVLDALANLIKKSGAFVRVVGYTDDAGTAVRNSPLSLARAQKVVDDLVARGVPAQQLVAVGRPNGKNVSQWDGAGSSNRRVEFEVGFLREHEGGR
ncbi:MAG: OmpA family protein [Hyphomicrobiaceae bacterium]